MASCDDVEADDGALDEPPANDDPTLATLFEPPHAAASMASPATATIAGATHSASGKSRRGRRRTRLLSFIASPSFASVPVLALKTGPSSANPQDLAAILPM